MDRKNNSKSAFAQIEKICRSFWHEHYRASFALIFLLGILAYWKSFFADFQFDDYVAIVDNPFIKHLDLSLLWSSYKVRFVTNFTYALNYFIGGLNVFSWHLANNLIHIAVSFLIYCFIQITFQTPRLKGQFDTDSQRLVALFSALIFLLHPIQTQAVTYIVQRATSIAAFFYIGALLFYARARLSDRTGDYAWVILFSFVGMLTKPVVITLPIVVILYDIVFFGVNKKFDISRIILYGILIIPLFIIPFILFGAKGLVNAAFIGVTDIPQKNYLLTQFNVIMTYVRLLFVPLNQNIDYDYKVATTLFEFPTLLSFTAILAIIGVALRLLKKERLLAFGIFWFLITLGPQSSIFSLLDVIYEHRVYLPCLGFAVFISAFLFKMIHSRRIYILVMSLIVGVFSVLTYQRNQLWSNAEKFMEDTVSRSPNKARPHNNLGFFYYRQGKFQKAECEYKKTLELDPGYYIAAYNLGMVYYEENKLMEARDVFLHLIRHYPAYCDPHVGLALTFAKVGRESIAFKLLQYSLTLNSKNASAYVALGNVYQNQNNLAKAKDMFQKALWNNPDSAVGYYNLGNVYFREGNFYEALVSYQKAVKLKSDFAGAYNNMGSIYFYFGDQQKAIKQYMQAINVDPLMAEAYFNLANSLYATGYVSDSKYYATKALELYRQQGRLDMVEKIGKKLVVGQNKKN